MSLDNLEEIRIFNQVVRSEGFTAAALVLQMPVNTISRRVASLETRLGVRLLNRSTRQISVTEEGETLFERSQSLLEEFEILDQDLRKPEDIMSGTLRVAVRTTTIRFGFIESLSAELQKYPNLKIQLIVTDDAIDLVANGIDLALMVDILPDSSLIQKKITEAFFGLCASPAYLNGKPPIRVPQDLAKYNYILPLKKEPQKFLILMKTEDKTELKVPLNPQFLVNDIRAREEAIHAGLGIGNLPTREIAKNEKEGKLVRVLPEYTLHPCPMWAVKPLDKKNDPRIKLIESLFPCAKNLL